MIQALDMTNQILRSAQEKTVSTIEGTPSLTTQKVLQALNMTGMKLGRFIFWRFLHKRARFQTVAKYNTGTVYVTQGSKTVTGSSTIWTGNMVGRAFKTNAYEEFYRIVAVHSPTSLELEDNYTGPTISAAAGDDPIAYVIAQDEYEINEDFDSELGVFQFKDPDNIEFLNPERFDELRYGPYDRTLGTTSALITEDPHYATIDVNSFGKLVMVLEPFSEDVITIVYTYYRMLNKLARDEDFWPFPPYIEPVIHDGALHYLSRDQKNDPRGQAQLQEFFSDRSELAGLTRMTDQFARFQPDTGIRRKARHRRRSLSGSVDFGSAFDRGI
jgi:hypothetical protein